MKLFKKLMVALSVLCLVGMLAACSDGNSNNNGGGSGGGWVIMYDGEVYLDGLTYDDIQEGIEWMNLETPADYTINQSAKTLTLTDDGYAKVEAFEENEMSENGEGNTTGDTYAVMYRGKKVMDIPAAAVSYYQLLLIEGTDYTVNESTKTITLTDAGMAKMSE